MPRLLRSFTRQAPPALAAVLVAAVGFLVLTLAQGPMRLSPDDGLYRSLATSLLTGHGYVDSGGSFFAVRPPGYPATLVPLLALGGPTSLLPWFAQAVLAGACVAVTSGLLVSRIGVPAMLVTLAGLASVPVFMDLGRSLRVDVLQVLLVMSAAYMLVRSDSAARESWLMAAGATLGLAVWVKEASLPYALLPVAWWFVAGADVRRLGAAVAATSLALVVSWPWWIWVAIQTRQVYPLATSSAFAPGLAVLALLAMLLIVIAARAASRRASVDPRVGPAAPSRRLLAAGGVGFAVATMVVMVGLYAGRSEQLAVAGALTADLRRFIRVEVLGELALLVPLLIIAAPTVVFGWRRLEIRQLTTLAVLGLPILLLVIPGARSSRSLLPLLIPWAAIGAWGLVAGARRVAGFVGRADWRPRHVLASLIIVVLLLTGVVRGVVGPGRNASEGPAWDATAVRRTATWLGRSVTAGSTVPVTWLFGWELYALTKAKVEMPLAPTIQMRYDAAKAGLVAVGTGYRFDELSATQAGRGLEDLGWLNYVDPSRSYVGLAPADLVEQLREADAAEFVITGESYQSNSGMERLVSEIDGLTPLKVFEGRSIKLTVLDVDQTSLNRPAVYPLVLNGPTLRALVRDYRTTGVADVELGRLLGAERMVLTEPFRPGDQVLLAALGGAPPDR